MPPNIGGFGVLHVVLAAVNVAEGETATVAAALRLNALAVAVYARFGLSLAIERLTETRSLVREALCAALVPAKGANVHAASDDASAVVNDGRFRLAAHVSSAARLCPRAR